jgi:hypothetical protein
VRTKPPFWLRTAQLWHQTRQHSGDFIIVACVARQPARLTESQSPKGPAVLAILHMRVVALSACAQNPLCIERLEHAGEKQLICSSHRAHELLACQHQLMVHHPTRQHLQEVTISTWAQISTTLAGHGPCTCGHVIMTHPLPDTMGHASEAACQHGCPKQERNRFVRNGVK